jgi:hypothetical protein
MKFCIVVVLRKSFQYGIISQMEHPKMVLKFCHEKHSKGLALSIRDENKSIVI